jgi:membrane-associated phospholipid phosphatase
VVSGPSTAGIPDTDPRVDPVPPDADLGPRVLAAAGWTIFGLLVVDRVGEGPIQALDTTITDLVPSAGALVTASGLATHLGDQVVLVAFTLLGIALLIKDRSYVDAGVLGVAKAVSASIVVGLQRIFERARPMTGPSEAACCSFPAQHGVEAAMVFMLLAVLLFDTHEEIRPWAEGVAIGTAIVVAATRVILDLVWFTDALAGLGLGWALAGTFLLLRIYLQGKKVLPDPVPGETVSDGVRLSVTEGVHVHDEACFLVHVEDVAEDRPFASLTDPLHAEEKPIPVERLVAREHHLPVERSTS